MAQLENKVAIVTGAASGIGRATAKLMAAEGARVLVADIDESAAGAVVGEIAAAGGEASALPVDGSQRMPRAWRFSSVPTRRASSTVS
jgi:NAD(P)-dependent dehydrogenase (short-subunit alcohol dehydrogenase family)